MDDFAKFRTKALNGEQALRCCTVGNLSALLTISSLLGQFATALLEEKADTDAQTIGLIQTKGIALYKTPIEKLDPVTKEVIEETVQFVVKRVTGQSGLVVYLLVGTSLVDRLLWSKTLSNYFEAVEIIGNLVNNLQVIGPALNCVDCIKRKLFKQSNNKRLTIGGVSHRIPGS